MQANKKGNPSLYLASCPAVRYDASSIGNLASYQTAGQICPKNQDKLLDEQVQDSSCISYRTRRCQDPSSSVRSCSLPVRRNAKQLELLPNRSAKCSVTRKEANQPGNRARAGNRRRTPARRRHGAPLRPTPIATTTCRRPRRLAPRRQMRAGAWRVRGVRRRRSSSRAWRAHAALAARRSSRDQESPELCAAGATSSRRGAAAASLSRRMLSRRMPRWHPQEGGPRDQNLIGLSQLKLIREKVVAFEGGAVESSKTRGEGEGSCGRCAIAMVCAPVPPATAKWSTQKITKRFGNEM